MALSGSCQTSTWQGSTYNGKLVFYWTATQNATNNTSTISWNISASISGGTNGWIRFGELSVVIDGSTEYYRDSSNLTDCKDGTVLASGTKVLTHNADGTRSFNVSIGAGIYIFTINERGSGSFTLNPINNYSLSISAGSGSAITVNRTSSSVGSTGNLSNGARLYNGDKLTISFSASNGYAISTHTVNGTVFQSGGSHTVNGNVSVVSAALQAYTLAISAGTGSSISVERTSSQCVSTGSLSNNAKVYNGDKLKISFTAQTNYKIVTHTVNGNSFTSGNTYTVSGNVTVVSTAQGLASVVSATNANINDSNNKSTITVTKSNNSYYHSLQYSFGSLSGYITSSGGTSSSEVKYQTSSISFTVPSSFYGQIPNHKSGTCTITCKTYSSSSSTTVIGSATTCTFTATAKESACKPTVTGTVTDTNAVTATLTGNSSNLVRYMSTAECVLTATAKNSASISSRKINGESVSASGGVYKKTITGVSSNSFSFEATDSRGYKTTATVSPTMINYTKLTCVPSVKRDSPTNNILNITMTGDCFRGSFGSVSNTFHFYYSYKESTDSSYSTWVEIPSSSITFGTRQQSGTSIQTYKAVASMTINDALSYQKTYNVRVCARDGACTVNGSTQYLNSIVKIVTVSRGLPVFDWGNNDFNINVPLNVNGNISVNGSNILLTNYADITLSNVAMTTLSHGGVYYYYGDKFTDYGINGVISGLVVVNWTGAAAMFYPTVASDHVCFMSNISQTVDSITLRVSYLTY